MKKKHQADFVIK